MNAVTPNDSVLSMLSSKIESSVNAVCKVISWCYLMLVAAIIVQLILRKGFANGLIALEELQWHLYAIGILFGLSYAQIQNAHIRVDIFHQHFNEKTKAIIEIVGLLLLAFPFLMTIFWHSLPFVYDAWRIGESSASPSGLPMRWLIKAVMPLSTGLLMVTMLASLLRKFDVLMGGSQHGR
ncbi:TRAP transporter small permease subunit [Endozoicomonas ascidiicola]|uniref:TRAP transporter small permease subunit n=1 Tax=Endozoicomonas ascidiicola TaxID=1698521 RepID=UPI000835CC62|nr:TRAP transporter small permease subunit [Endozoicomonas ascidiicola]